MNGSDSNFFTMSIAVKNRERTNLETCGQPSKNYYNNSDWFVRIMDWALHYFLVHLAAP